MNYFMIEGTIQNAEHMSQEKLNEHMEYTQKAMDRGQILFSGLKTDNSGGIFAMKAESRQAVDDYLSAEPFHKSGIQTYNVTQFTPHYLNENADKWAMD